MPAGPERRLATLLLLLFIGLSQIVNTQEGALVAGLVLCAAGVAVLRSEAGPFWRQCGTAMAFAGELLVIFGISDSTSFTNACLFVLALAVAVYVLGTDLILRFLSGLLIAGAAAGLIWRGLSPALVDENLFDALWRFDSARAAFLWLPIAVTGAWGAAVAFSLSRRDASPRARARRWPGPSCCRCSAWCGWPAAFPPAAAGHVGGQPAFGRAGGCRRLAAGRRGAVRAGRAAAC